MKRIDYEYDLVSGKVNFVRYQDNMPDRFYYKYSYDAENRVTQAWSGTQAIVDVNTGSTLLPDNRRLDAQYYYYLHGPLARMELGDNKVQGADYAYTLQGWLKGVNSSAVTSTLDMGNDAGTSHPTIALDAYGYSLSYYGSSTAIDYKPITGTQPFATTLAANNNLRQLYNGNITTSGMNIPQLSAYWLDRKYTYDQLNRLTGAQLYHTTASVAPAGTSDYREAFSYDANGNILTANRHGSTTNSGQQLMDSLAYNYNRDGNGRLTSNRLNYLTDQVPAANYSTDLDNQTTGNYTYDQTGNITADVQAGLSKVNWSVYGKIRSLTAGSGNITYTYNPSGQRVSKIAGGVTTWYVRDAQGNTLAVYDNKNSVTNWREQTLYGSARLGIWLPNTRLGQDSSIKQWDTVGYKQYELNNHLGNVMVTVTDKRLQHTTNGTAVDYYQADVATAQEYYSFGALMPARTYPTTGKVYRYGFNGKENDNEVKGTGNQQDYGMRIYDPRLVRFMSVDSLAKKFPELSSYQFGSNSPILNIDLDGLEASTSLKKVLKDSRGAPVIIEGTKQLVKEQVGKSIVTEGGEVIFEETLVGGVRIFGATFGTIVSLFIPTSMGHDEIKPIEKHTSDHASLTDEELRQISHRLLNGTASQQDLLYAPEVQRRFNKLDVHLSIVRIPKFNGRPLIIDENLSPKIAAALADQGFNVITVKKGTADETIATYAKANNAIVVTNNEKDFINKGITIFKVSEDLKKADKLPNVVKAIENVNEKSKSDETLIAPGNKVSLTQHQ